MRSMPIIFASFLLAVVSVFGQENVLYSEVQQAKKSNIKFEDAALREARAEASLLKNFVNPTEVFFFEKNSIDAKVRNSKAINLVMPLRTKNMTLELIEMPESFYDFEVVMSNGNKFPANANREIRSYRGVVRGVKNSLAAVTFYKDEIMGIVATDEGNFNIVKDKKSGKHLFYNDRNLKEKPGMKCGTVDDPSLTYDSEVLFRPRSVLSEDTSGGGQTRLINKEVRFYVETEYDIYQALGSDSANTVAYIIGLFTPVAILYVNENIMPSIAQAAIWAVPDPYNGTRTDSLLSQFQRERPTIVGDLGILLTFRPVGGGLAAGFSGLCNPSTAQKLSVAEVYNSYSPFPTYSWSVALVAHELGHLFGSRHTHACVWNGNNTAIDGCSRVEGDCARPGVPSEGGTIMSYCDVGGGPGINFNLGFGPQPGNVIRNNVANASCLLECFRVANFTNQTVNTDVNVYAGIVNVENATVNAGGRLNINACTNVNITQPFTVQNGAVLNVKVGQ